MNREIHKIKNNFDKAYTGINNYCTHLVFVTCKINFKKYVTQVIYLCLAHKAYTDVK